MEHLVKCGMCGTALAEVPDRTALQKVCANCHFKYQIINGRVAANESRQVVQRRIYREYELQVELGSRDVEIVPRFAAIDRALATLEKQRAVDVALREGYERVLKMLDIELEAGAATDQFDSDVTATLLAKLDELKELEARQADLIRELSANAEVEQLLRAREE